MTTSALYGLVKLSYDRHYLLPLEEALAFVKLVSQSKLVETDYGDKLKALTDYSDEITIKVLTEEKVKQMHLELSLEI